MPLLSFVENGVRDQFAAILTEGQTMTACVSHSHVAAYVSGVALGAVVLFTAVAPHLKFDGFSIAQAAPACAGRVTPDQADGLRAAVFDADWRRDRLVHAASSYAAAKIGVAPEAADPSAVKAADAVAGAARARFAQACV
jgi:hypothetical protein